MQHYVFMLGSLIVIPLVVVPAMGGTQVSGCLVGMVLFDVLFEYIFCGL